MQACELLMIRRSIVISVIVLYNDEFLNSLNFTLWSRSVRYFSGESMSTSFELTAQLRTDLGKGASRRLRHAGHVPAIMYGAGKDPIALTFSHNELQRNLANEAFYSHILTINIDGQASEKAVLKDLQRHPSRPILMHMDLLRVSETDEITIHVPLHFINEDSCAGVKTGGGIVSHLMVELEIRCLPKDLPEFIAVDIAPMQIGDIVHLSELNLPNGVHIPSLVHGDQAVVSLHLPRGGEETTGEATPES
jgi:large subunit ribosomal protein L25